MNMEKKRAWVMALVMQCPFVDPLPECPAVTLRGLPLSEQMSAVDEMIEETMDRILETHQRCLGKREGGD